jgi:hypothetical protein
MALSTSLFIAVGRNRVKGQIGTSIDNGSKWTEPNIGSLFDGTLEAIGGGTGIDTDGKGNWVAVGGNSTTGQIGYSTNNGNSWSISNIGSLFQSGGGGGGYGYGVATDSKGNWVAIGTNGTEAQIGYSSNNGKDWTISTNIGSLFDGVGGGGGGYSVATDSKGNWVAVGTSATINQIGYSSDNGKSWTSSNSNLFSGGGGGVGIGVGVGVATDGKGNWVAVGVNYGLTVQIGISNNNGNTWSPISTSLFSGSEGRGVATDGNGNWVAVGKNVNRGQIGYSNDNGNNWSISNIGTLFDGNSGIAGAGYSVATDGIGNWVAVGQNGNINKGQIGYSNDNGKNWTISINNLFDEGSGIGIAAAPPAPVPVPIPASNICFLAGTPIKTDQGIVPIDKIDVMYHTIGNKVINYITQTVTVDKYLVLFKKNCLGRNWPSQDTIMTKDHKVLYKGELAPAYKFMNISPDVKKYKYNGEILYNVLMEEHETMNVNNLICETLHPDNIIAKLYRSRFTDYHNDNVIITMNESLQKRNLYGYKSMINRMAIL